MLHKAIYNQTIIKRYNSESLLKVLIRKYHQFKPKDKVQVYDAPLPHDLQAHGKDILLFRYENPMKVLRFSVIALTQFPIWSWLSYFTLDLRSRLTPYKESDVLDRKGSGWIYQKTVYGAATSRFLAFGYFCCGVALSGYGISRSLNTVRRVVLRKGGKHVTIVSYGVLGYTSRYTTRAVSQCSTVQLQAEKETRLFMNVKGKRFRYQFNLEDGIFNNKALFFRTIGQHRVLE